MTLALYRRRAFRKEVCTSGVLRRAFDKAVRRKPPAVAADAGPMQIQLRERNEVGAELLRSDSPRKWKEAVCRRARHREIERADAHRSFVL